MKSENKYNVPHLNDFVAREWQKVLSFLQRHYGLSEDDCKDIFQESFIVLYNKIQAGELDNLTSSLSTYFISICKNKAKTHIRSASKSIGVDELSLTMMDEIQTEKIEALLSLENNDATIEARKHELVRTIVENLPSPCNELLWGFYRDNLSMRALAEMYNYKSESVVKVTKHRCCEKFRAKYNELCNKIF